MKTKPSPSLSKDASDFLETLLFVAESDDQKHVVNWTIHEFHPEFVAGLERFLSGFRAYLAELDEKTPDSDVYSDPDACERSFGGNVFFSLSGHGCGFWDDRDMELGESLHEALVAYSDGVRYRFEGMESGLAKFSGKIHFAYRTAEFRREAVSETFVKGVQFIETSDQ